MFFCVLEQHYCSILEAIGHLINEKWRHDGLMVQATKELVAFDRSETGKSVAIVMASRPVGPERT